MFERFTEPARKATVLAQDEARRFGHNYIGTEHLLLGLLAEGEGVAAQSLVALGATFGKARVEVERIVGYGQENVAQAPFTPRSKKVLELALREALQLGHNYIGTEHILLGLIRESEGVAARVLSNFDADADKVRREVVRRLSGAAGRGKRNTLPPFPPKPAREDAVNLQAFGIAPDGKEIETFPSRLLPNVGPLHLGPLSASVRTIRERGHSAHILAEFALFGKQAGLHLHIGKRLS